jgi:hypothetical protein
VVPQVATSTGFAWNITPLAVLARLQNPNSFFGDATATTGSITTVRVLAALIALGVVAATALILWRPRGHPRGRALEAAAVVAATPLVATLVWVPHLLLLLLPMLVLLQIGLDRGDRRLVGLVALSWVAIGPVQVLLLNIIHWGVPFWVFRPLPEFASLAVVAIWVACLVEVRRHDRLVTSPARVQTTVAATV